MNRRHLAVAVAATGAIVVGLAVSGRLGHPHRCASCGRSGWCHAGGCWTGLPVYCPDCGGDDDGHRGAPTPDPTGDLSPLDQPPTSDDAVSAPGLSTPVSADMSHLAPSVLEPGELADRAPVLAWMGRAAVGQREVVGS